MPRRVVRRLGRQLGRRGAILSGYGVVWLIVGWGLIVQPQPDQRGLSLLLSRAPLYVWAWCWIVAGLIALVCAWLPQGRDAPGFVALVVIVVPWMASYLASWVLGVYPRGWAGAAVWTAITVPIMVVLGWPEPPRSKRAEPPYES